MTGEGQESRWDGFTYSELDELALSLDHRLAEAEAGNAFVYTHIVGPLLIDLCEHHPQLAASEVEDVRERVAVFDQAGVYEQMTGAPTTVLRVLPEHLPVPRWRRLLNRTRARRVVMSNRMSSEEVEALPWRDVESSNVARVAWVQEAVVDEFSHPEKMHTVGSLYVEFIETRSGGVPSRVYRYVNVRGEQHGELVEADSVGGYLNAEIKPVHKCERIEVVPGPASPPRPAGHRPVG